MLKANLTDVQQDARSAGKATTSWHIEPAERLGPKNYAANVIGPDYPETEIIYAVAYGETPEEAETFATLISQAWTMPALREALEASNRELITHRAALRDRITGVHGSIVIDPDNVTGVAEMAKMDALIEASRAALALSGGE